MATAPTYQPPVVDKNAELTSARAALDPGYQQMIGYQQANVPLYQQELQNTKTALQQQQDLQTNALNTGATRLAGQAGASNAARGLYNSTFTDNTKQNINTDKDMQVQSLIDDILNRTKTAQNTFDKQKLGVDTAVGALQNDEAQKADAMATGAVNQKTSEYNSLYDRLYKTYQDQVAQEQFQKQMDQRASLAALARGNSADTLEQQKQATLADALNKAFTGADGKPTNDQDAVYRNILRLSPQLKAVGVSDQALWDAWQPLHDQYYNGKSGAAAQSLVDSLSRTNALNLQNSGALNYAALQKR